MQNVNIKINSTCHSEAYPPKNTVIFKRFFGIPQNDTIVSFLNFTLSFCIIIFSFSICSAAGIEISPSRFEVIVDANKPFTDQIHIANPTADVQVFEIYADEFSELFEFNPASFTLEGGTRKTVQLTVNFPPREGTWSGKIISTTISVLGKPLADSRFQAATGVKIPVSITFASSAKKSAIPYYYQIPAALGILAATVYLSFLQHYQTKI